MFPTPTTRVLPMVPEISPTDLSAWMQAKRAHGQPELLDVREPGDTLAQRPMNFPEPLHS